MDSRKDTMDHENERPDRADEDRVERIGALPQAAEVVPEQWVAIRAAIEASMAHVPRTAGGTHGADAEPARPGPARSRGWGGRWWVRVAAAVTLLAGGVAGGFAAGQRHAAAPRSSVDEAMALAADVQRTGSEYVAALAAFTAVVDSLSADVRLQGRDAAIATLVGAAAELAALTDAELAVNPLSGPPGETGRIRF